MVTLAQTLTAWNTTEFNNTLKAELMQLTASELPLQAGLTQGGYANDQLTDVTILDVQTTSHFINIKAGLFYTSIIAGCSCADDPTPVDVLNEYCVITIELDQRSGAALIKLTED
ncbi:MAG: hypothetical protein OEZ39_16735 [Gammaproteobacteria bacterium]|nr:hypothetical protein [Gammaproteobacteria bacterium]MDH5653507.1 hypothetical protein [Gammaproteobacteria bacterium]